MDQRGYMNRVQLLKLNFEKNICDGIFNDAVKETFLLFLKTVYFADNWSIFGGLALSKYVTSFNSHDIDILIPTPIFIPPNTIFNSVDFKTPEQINQPLELVKEAINNSTTEIIDGTKIKILTPKYIIALKLKRALGTTYEAMQDRTDILKLLEVYNVKIDDLNLPEDQVKLFNQLKENVSETGRRSGF